MGHDEAPVEDVYNNRTACKESSGTDGASFRDGGNKLSLPRRYIPVVGALMMRDLRFFQIDMGLLFSAFPWGYALFQVPAGAAADRWGPGCAGLGRVRLGAGRRRDGGFGRESIGMQVEPSDTVPMEEQISAPIESRVIPHPSISRKMGARCSCAALLVEPSQVARVTSIDWRRRGYPRYRNFPPTKLFRLDIQ